jgi:hypothetical protein
MWLLVAAALGLVLAGTACAGSDAGSKDAGASGDAGVDAAAFGLDARVGAEAAPQMDASNADDSTTVEGGGPLDGAPLESGMLESGTPDSATPGSTYDELVLADDPVAYWAMTASSGSEPDLTGNGHTGTYKGGAPTVTTLPNGDSVADFNGSSGYMNVASSAVFSIPTTGNLTWEGWIRPDVLQFPHDDGSSGYVDWMGKCDSYSGPPPTCEWEARMYDTTTMETPNRPNRLSAYVFNPSAGLGSAADWQPNAGLIQAGTWYHVVGEYTTASQPAGCFTDCASSGSSCPNAASSYPGSINIWVNGVEWNQGDHSPTGCMCQYCVVPVANSSGVDVGTMAMDTWFAGAIGKVAIYDRLLTAAQITSHYGAMTAKTPDGSCANTCSL